MSSPLTSGSVANMIRDFWREHLGSPFSKQHGSSPLLERRSGSEVPLGRNAPQDGLSLSALRAFCAERSGKLVHCTDAAGHSSDLVFEQLTTGQVCFALVMPVTEGAGPGGESCTYVDVLRRSQPALVGPATRFVSHAWSCLFADLVAALEALESAEEAFFWIDIFVGAQHKSSVLPPSWWSTAFRQSVVDIGRTVLVLQPWSAPAALRRSWCLWEVYCTLDSEIPLTIALNSLESATFRKIMLEQPDAVKDALGGIDVRMAEATKVTDQEMIHEAVQACSGGFAKVNELLRGMRQSWLTDEASSIAAWLSDSEVKDLDWCERVQPLANFLRKMGKEAEALLLDETVLQQYASLLGEDHPHTLITRTSFAFRVKEMGNTAEAATLFDDLLQRLQAMYLAHSDNLHPAPRFKVLFEMGRLARETDRLEEATTHFRSAFSLADEVFGAVHTNTLHSGYQLVSTLIDRGKLAEAEPICQKVRIDCYHHTGGDDYLQELVVKQLKTILNRLCYEERERQGLPRIHFS